MAGYMVRAAQFIIGRGIPLADSLYVLLLAMPAMIGYTVPMSILTVVLIVFGNLSQNNELRAMKASGIHLFHILLPALVIGLALSFTMFVFNDQITSNAGFILRKTTKQMIIKHPSALIEPGRFVNINDSIIFLAKTVENGVMKDIVAYEVGKSNKPVRTIIAESGKIVSQNNSTEILIQLYNGSISDSEDEGINTMQFKIYEFPTIGQDDIRKMQKKKKDLTLAEMLVRLSRRDVSEEDRTELWTAFHQRISFSLGSFIFVFLGIPIAVLVRRGEIVLSFGIAMISASLYYILFVGAKTLSLQGFLPPIISLWIPNILLLGVGYHLFRRSLIS